MARPPLRPVPDPPAAPRTRASRAGIRPERLMVWLVVGLVCFGMVMVYSASSSRALLTGHNPMSFVIRQGLFALVGGAAFWVCAHMDARALRRLGAPALVVSGVLLLAVLIPGVGQQINGSRRWLPLPLVGQLQPAELAKVAVVLWVAAVAARSPGRLRTLRGLMPVLIVTGMMSALILVEPDLGTASTLFVVSLSVLLVAGAEIRHIVGVAAASGTLAMIAIASSSYRRDRVLAFLDPSADPGGIGYQILQARVAFGVGGVTGKGLGDGLQKANYLPEAHTDMILATIGEELGVVGVLGTLFAIAMVALLAYRIALSTADLHRRLVATGLATLIAVQGLDNIAATLGMMPITGVPLPFVSYGGSSLIVLLASVGVLVNIAHGVDHERAVSTRPDERRDRRGGDGRARDAGAGRGRSAARAGR